MKSEAMEPPAPALAPVSEVRRAMERLPDLVNADVGLSFRCRAMSLDFVIASESDRFYARVGAGRMEPVARGSQILRPSALAFAAAPATWLAHWRPVPGPGEYDLFALVKDERMAIEGDMRALMRHLQNFKDLLAAPRALYEEA